MIHLHIRTITHHSYVHQMRFSALNMHQIQFRLGGFSVTTACYAVSVRELLQDSILPAWEGKKRQTRKKKGRTEDRRAEGGKEEQEKRY